MKCLISQGERSICSHPTWYSAFCLNNKYPRAIVLEPWKVSLMHLSCLTWGFQCCFPAWIVKAVEYVSRSAGGGVATHLQLLFVWWESPVEVIVFSMKFRHLFNFKRWRRQQDATDTRLVCQLKYVLQCSDERMWWDRERDRLYIGAGSTFLYVHLFWTAEWSLYRLLLEDETQCCW